MEHNTKLAAGRVGKKRQDHIPIKVAPIAASHVETPFGEPDSRADDGNSPRRIYEFTT